MKRFKYKAKNADGKTVIGIVEAPDERRAVAAIRERKLVVISLSFVNPDIFSQMAMKIFRGTTSGDLTNFTRQLSTMITTGLTINDCLTILKNQSSPSFGEIIDDISRSIEGGTSLADSMTKHPKVFSKVYVALVRAGEAAGVLDQILSRLADNLEKQREFKSKVKGAMIYPIIIIIGMVIVGAIMMIFVIPKLLEMYKDFQATLPLPTLVLMSISNFMVTYWWIMLMVFIGLGWAFTSFRHTAYGRRQLDELILRLPIFGNLQKEIILTEATRTLGLLVAAGISVIEALNITAAAVGNTLFEERLKDAALQVEKGLSLGMILKQFEEFPPIVAQMISVGEETGKMDEILTKLSRYFEQESEQMVKGLTTAIEPIIMVILGVGVGFLVIAVILPIYNLTSAF
ncbi:MAG: type II secretion system F family protein [bacterium]|nr:type II secretion system F family protein [bacterium]